jgi:hypothetical protein
MVFSRLFASPQLNRYFFVDIRNTLYTVTPYNMDTTSVRTVTEYEQQQLDMLYGKPMSMRQTAEKRRRSRSGRGLPIF